MTQNTEQNVRTRDEQAQWMVRCIRASGDHPSIEGFLREHIRIAEARGAEEQRRKDGELSRAKLFCQNEQEASDRTPERPDVVQWQKDRNEFFLSSTLEVVTEYAAWRDTKDGEARDTPSAYVLPDDFYNDEGDERCGLWSGDQIGKYTLPLYTRPANIAALEARIASLKEAEQLARADAEASKARVTVLEEEKNHEFNRGYLIACCNVANMHDEPAIACDVLAEGDLTEDDIEAAKLAEYDATALLEIRRARGDQDPIRAALTREGGV